MKHVCLILMIMLFCTLTITGALAACPVGCDECPEPATFAQRLQPPQYRGPLLPAVIRRSHASRLSWPPLCRKNQFLQHPGLLPRKSLCLLPRLCLPHRL